MKTIDRTHIRAPLERVRAVDDDVVAVDERRVHGVRRLHLAEARVVDVDGFIVPLDVAQVLAVLGAG